MSDIELSVIIPCKNEGATLADQLDSLARQDWDGAWEVIVVDNGSTDDSAAVAFNHAGLRNRIRVVHAEHAKCVAAVRRCGVEASAARSVVFCDGDDIVGVEWVRSFGIALREHECVTGQTEVDRLNEPGLAASRGRKQLGVAPRFGPHTILSGCTGGMTRAAWNRFDGFDESFEGLEDIELSLRIAAAGERVEFVPAAVVHYRYRSEARALWKQGRFYGASQVALSRRCRALGVQPPRSHAWKSWLRLFVLAPMAWHPSRRLAWLWLLACRLGALRAAAKRS